MINFAHINGKMIGAYNLINLYVWIWAILIFDAVFDHVNTNQIIKWIFLIQPICWSPLN